MNPNPKRVYETIKKRSLWLRNAFMYQETLYTIYSEPRKKGSGLQWTPTQNVSMKRLRNAHYDWETLLCTKKRSILYILGFGVLSLGVFMRY